jgi:hypothetical protein
MSLRTTVFSLILAALSFLPASAFAAHIYLDPSTATYGPGDTFIVTVRIDNEDDCINAASVELTYPTKELRAVDFSRGDSILSLWAVEPHIDTTAGSVIFAGGIPGGYCGRIAGDAALSNVLGEVVFTVESASAKDASISVSPGSAVYLNNGQGTEAKLNTSGTVVTLASTSQQTTNPWLEQVKADVTPPQPFTIDVESTKGVFGGKYYVVFSTSDKESGVDHFEISENGGWKKITSPYVLRNQSLLGIADIELRAVDKAGNTQLGTYVASKTPKRQLSLSDFIPIILFVLILMFAAVKTYWDTKVRPPAAI